MSTGNYFCPYCRWPLTRAQVRREITFECPVCHSTLRCVLGRRQNYVRQIVMLLVTIAYAWRHGWDGGFVIFLLGFYACVGLFIYLFFALTLMPFGELQLVAPPVSKKYLNTKPLSEEESESRSKSIRPMGIT
jgi:hypothetical protein